MVTNFTPRWRGSGTQPLQLHRMTPVWLTSTHLLAVPESVAIKGNDCENTDNAPTPQLAPPAITFNTVNTDIVCLKKQNSQQQMLVVSVM